MARTQNTITGRMSGSIGGIRFSTWKGINVAASKPETVANPKTAKQMAQREKMAGVVSIYRTAPELFTLGFIQYAVKQSGFNAWVSDNLKNGFWAPDADGITPDYTKLVASRGTLNKTAITGLLRGNGSKEVKVSFPATFSGDQLDTDNACALVLTSKGNFGFSVWSGTQRKDGSILVPMLNTVTGDDNLFIYLFFYQEGSRKVSDSALLVDRGV